MTEDDILNYLKKEEYMTENQVCNATAPTLQPEYPLNSMEKSDVMVLPLSLEDEVLTSGTAGVLRELSSDLSIPGSREQEYVFFNAKVKKYEIDPARNRFLFYKELDEHVKAMAGLRNEFRSEQAMFEARSSDEQAAPEDKGSGSGFKTRAHQQSQRMKILLKSMISLVDKKTLQNAFSEISLSSPQWLEQVDEYDRHLIHVAVEDGNHLLVEALLLAGAPVNSKEGCGFTPIMLSINKQDTQMVKILLRYGAKIIGTFPGNIPSPMQFAKAIGDQDILTMLETDLGKKQIQECQVFQLLSNTCDQYTPSSQEDENTNQQPVQVPHQKRNLVITVGDVKTTVNIRGVRNRAPDEFGPFKEAPGDFHTQGYIMQCLSRIIGPGGFYYVARHILRRLKVTPKSFDDIFKEGNFERNFHALTDFYWGLMIAAVKEFEESDFFPPQQVLKLYERQNKDHGPLLVKSFKDWLRHNNSDKTFNYFSLFLTKFAPLLLNLHQAVRMGNGKEREACWLEMPAIFAAFNKKNYKSESFVHVLNFTALWPQAYREMFRLNCSINARGKQGHNFAIDEYMESFVVKPVKLYARKQTTLQMLEKICMNLEVLEHVKDVYRKGFGITVTTKSSIPDPTPDRVKVAWFAIQNKWFQNCEREHVKCYPHTKKELIELNTNVPNECHDVEQRGRKILVNNFKEMVARLFPVHSIVW